VFKVSNKTEYN